MVQRFKVAFIREIGLPIHAHMGSQEIRSVSWRLPDYPRELACMLTNIYSYCKNDIFISVQDSL